MRTAVMTFDDEGSEKLRKDPNGYRVEPMASCMAREEGRAGSGARYARAPPRRGGGPDRRRSGKKPEPG